MPNAAPHSIVTQQGTPALLSDTIATTTTPAPAPPAKSDDMTISLGHVGIVLGVVVALITIVGAVMKVMSDRRKEDREWIERIRKDDNDLHRASHAAIDKDINEIRHDIKNEKGRIDALDTKRQEADRWQAKMDITVQSIEKSQERIESALRELPKDILAAIDTRNDVIDKQLKNIVDSVREIREVKPKT